MFLNRFADSINNFLRNAVDWQSKPIQIATYFAIVLPVTLIAIYSYVGDYYDLTEAALLRRQSIARLAATALEERFFRLLDVGTSLATRMRFRQLVAEGKWDEAIEILKDVPVNFPFIDRVFLADPAGTLMADNPVLPGVRGNNFAARDWYKGVTQHWKPYLSNVYQRAAEPRFNVVAAAVPIEAEKRIVGILVLQVQLDELVTWSTGVEIGPSGSVYFLDRAGQLGTHPKRPSHAPLLNYSSVPVVPKVLRGESGVEIIFDPLESEQRVAAYAPVSGIGWGVIASEPTRTAFAARNDNLRRDLIFYGLLVGLTGLLAYVILRTLVGLKKAEDHIQTLNKDLSDRALELQTANKELEAFSYSVSHDLRAPLRAIDGFSQALAEDYSETLDATGTDYLNRIRSGTRRMAELIDDLLNLSRVSRSAMKRAPVSLSAMAESILRDLQQADPERSVNIEIAHDVTADGDERLLRVALENLLGNAWKFTGKCEQPIVQFGILQHNGTPSYFVRDNGAGFDMAYADKLFGPFQRLHAMTEFNGTGIGLATVQRIVHRHGGRVWAEAEVEKGATFYFTLG